MTAARILLLLAGLCLPATLPAAEYHAVQGAVVRVEADLDARSGPVRLEAFERSWPVRRTAPGRWIGWIGVDLAARPGAHAIRWRSGKGELQQTLIVEPGHFRISRIEVPRTMAEFDAPTLARIRSEAARLRACYKRHIDAHADFVVRGWPVNGVLSTPFGARRIVNGEPRAPHSGLDIAAPAGTPVLAPIAGRVLLTESMYLNGNTVVLGHGDGLVSVYSHLEHIAVKPGEWVEAGRPLGRVGATGRATGPHLHWGMRFNGARIDPRYLMNEEDGGIADLKPRPDGLS